MAAAKAAKLKPSTMPPAAPAAPPRASAIAPDGAAEQPDDRERADARRAAAGCVGAGPPAALEPDQQADAERDRKT